MAEDIVCAVYALGWCVAAILLTRAEMKVFPEPKHALQVGSTGVVFALAWPFLLLALAVAWVARGGRRG